MVRESRRGDRHTAKNVAATADIYLAKPLQDLVAPRISERTRDEVKLTISKWSWLLFPHDNHFIDSMARGTAKNTLQKQKRILLDALL